MDQFQIETRMVVAGGGIREPIVLRDTKKVGDVNYFRAQRSDELSRLLSGTSRRKVRPLRNTNVFDVVKKLRHRIVEDIVHPPAQVDLGLDDDQPEQPRKYRRRQRDDREGVDGEAIVSRTVIRRVGVVSGCCATRQGRRGGGCC